VKKLFYTYYNYLRYRLKAVNEHGVHSPFVFDLLTTVIYNQSDYYSFKSIENLKGQLLNSPKTAPLTKTHLTNNPKYGRLLFRLVNHFQPAKIIEINTSVGIHTAYLAAVNSKIEVITIQEKEELASIAKLNFKQLKLKNIEQKTGASAPILKDMLCQQKNLPFIYSNENDSKQNTLTHFYLCLEKATDSSIFIISNMYVSPDMKGAWEEIKNNSRVTVTLDLFFIGIVFFRKEQVKQHFVIKF
jgi:predicted O-methyltransferase YrrM